MAKLMFVLFQVLIPILLLNMLIAMMGNTYAIVNEKSDKEFLKQVFILFYTRPINLGVFITEVCEGLLVDFHNKSY